ncbi:malonate decarboxylase subunit epsilon [Acinetobacter larvae]|uniref:Malonyl CoA-acyl carrier protein transacylase n=1 Tax=Acinetobacter larvae TaxID=1789224 RepID=A0A1B2LXZ9_9GAMM|nr:malonate decarboxylase subunit epsilon [Acinetobacter larvae]AOA57824.1 malonate decarboxylase subunit epsilon [Acinetobacter larvae]
MRSILVFPGQGAQKVDMLHALYDDPLAKQYIDQASDCLGEDVLCLDQASALKSTYAVQICLYIAGAISSAWLYARNVRTDYVAGLSIGAWAAAQAAGVLSFEDGLKLVAKRAQLMQQAYPQGYGMMAILSAEYACVAAWVAQVHEQGGVVFVANINADRQVVISGTHSAMQSVAAYAQQQGVKSILLDVSVPSHCALLTQQAEQLAQAMQELTYQQPQIAYLSGSSGRLLSQGSAVIDDICFNMCRMIDWESTVQAAWERGARIYMEALPGTVLSGLAKKVFREGRIHSFQITSLENLVVALQHQGDLA